MNVFFCFLQSRWFAGILVTCLSIAGDCTAMVTPQAGAESINLVPMPTQVKMRQGEVVISPATRIVYQRRKAPREIETTLEPLANVLAQELEMLTGLRLNIVAEGAHAKADANDILLRFNDVQRFTGSEVDEDQSYDLTVSRQGVVIQGQYYKGVVYGTATLIQSLRIKGEHFSFPALHIEDKPHANYRGVMLDVARKPHSIGTLKEAIQLARLYKIRYMHLHLTDDQHFTFPFEPVVSKLKNNFSYTRQQLVDLVAYADARGVTLIPEMDLPGHSSRLRESGFISPSANDYDVADPANYSKITAIIDDMLSVFHSSPYFHIGGDESGAGNRLVPFLAAMNRHVRSLPEGEKRRLMMWEGFHGAPTDQLPATGPDHVIVHSWESSYNAPWDLLDNGYTLINSSWKPLYVVGHGTPWHPGSGFRGWSPEVLYGWDKDTLMHWEPGRPLFRDADPDPNGDSNRSDRQWSAAENNQQDQMLGGQLIFWEQREDTVIKDLSLRLPAVAERLWNPSSDLDFDGFAKRQAAVHDAVMTIVQPVEILPTSAEPASPINLAYRFYKGEEVNVVLRNRTRIPGQIRYSLAGFSNSLTYFSFGLAKPVTAESKLYDKPFIKKGGFAIRAQLFREDGTPVLGNSWENYNNWPNRVQVTEFDIDNQILHDVPNFADFEKDKEIRNYQLPMLRGPMNHVDLIGQMFTATMVAPGTGKFTFQAKTRQGHASVYVDLNRDGKWSDDEKLVAKTPRNEKPIPFELDLVKGENYAVRIDHVTYLPGPVVILTVSGPGIAREREEISTFLAPIDDANTKSSPNAE